MTYKEKLRLPQWQKKRNAILDRDSYTCQNPTCGCTTKNLQVHHTFYIKGIDPWDYPDDFLKTLCEDCHQKETGREELERHLSNTLKMKGFFVSDLLAMSCKLENDVRFTKFLLHVLRQYQNG